ncbi:50S ribosomal protein L35 [Candidatus Peregrinibacteria bacterium]|nr:50S ribosomal protein L35 [Candidatus Peregrinibacteria bacterium]
MKLKTHRGLKKRIKISARGKIMFRKPGKKHLLINKSKRQKSLHPLGKPLTPSDERKVHQLLPMSF